jgi:hypothetical protein
MKIRSLGAELFHADRLDEAQKTLFAILRTRLITGKTKQRWEEIKDRKEKKRV